MKYQIADQVNGPFSEVFDSLQQAEKELAECIKEGQEINDRETPEGFDVPDASNFFCIVNAETGEEI